MRLFSSPDSKHAIHGERLAMHSKCLGHNAYAYSLLRLRRINNLRIVLARSGLRLATVMSEAKALEWWVFRLSGHRVSVNGQQSWVS